MNKLKISRIQIKNFKHIEELVLDFSNKDLIVLDGPNGFGKTTVFDAVELVLTGKISRIKNTADGRIGYGDILFANNSELDTEIKVEFIGENDCFVIAKRIDSKKRLTAVERKPDNWEVFETYHLSDFDIPVTEGDLISNEDIETILSIDNLERYFSLFYYVQQEENTLFLKQNAKERMDEISQLFDTYNEETELKKLQIIKSKITTELKRLDGPKGELANKENTKNLLINGLKDLEKKDIQEIEYFVLFQEENTLKEWDKEKITLNKESREKFLQELREVYILVRNIEKFLDTEFNNEIYKLTENKKLLAHTILTYNFLEEYGKFKKLKDKETTLKRIKHKITKENLDKNLIVSHFTELQELLSIKINIEDIEIYISNLKSYKLRMGEVSEVIQQLNVTRETLMTQYNKIKEEFESVECPLCGNPYKSYENLITSVNEKEKVFSQMLDKDTNKYSELYNELFLNHVDKILLEIEKYLLVEQNIINEDLYKVFIEALRNKNAINNFVDWCENNNLDISSSLNTEFRFVENIDAKVQQLIDLLLLQIKTVDSSYANHESNKSTFNTVFSGDIKKVRKIDLVDIIKKVKYIDYQYYYNSSENIKVLQREIDQMSTKRRKIILAEQKIKVLIEVYEQKILNHWKKIITDIEIPFYIYTGKIMQNYQRGCGLFIHDNESFGQKSIRFVSNLKSDHDAINYLSSGQLSGLVIAFTLALNKVYGENSIDIIMIDDPVQTMDEINIASLTELLRNEFKRKQIIMSTHEEEVSRYIRYKFAKYDLKTMRLNIKNEIYTNRFEK
ncbi:AAA family ATPase [Bacillus sp. S70]|uniref:ATP-binding protein n=2 Tax=Bacillus TaxID=1386 RepID=UPI00190B355A|nr:MULTISPECIES: AAA family ATPase [unclassified Bacillus (in: firmicutes)]MBJ9978551.1 AAA family ATPase [Bacillus sp. S29]MBK0100385.1 AAA family ATPase [Bacillus sp. S70]MBK0107114.1 AAA family ATPase [Bacillus sp. S73]MBK0136027.1 AAA family ATPase [Bacillus sp. S72]MBK0161699.1 AAA family ATPase [Bacillus sp. S71]